MSDQKAPKPVPEMTQDELREENKRLGLLIKALQARKAAVEDAYAAAQEAEKAADAIRSLSPAKRSALLRALEVQHRADEKARQEEAARLAALVAAEPPPPAPEPPPPPNPLVLTDAQRSAVVRNAEVKAAQ
jgi:hypothetical protein